MSVMAWLFPELENLRREALARLEWDQQRRRTYQAAMRPVWDLISQALPLIEAEEVAGRQPTYITIPRAQLADFVNGFMAQDDYFNRTDFMTHGLDGAKLLGLCVRVGETLSVE